MLQPDPPTQGVDPLGQPVTLGDPPGTKMKLLISYETTTPHLGQLLFFYTDETAILQLKLVLRNWAGADGPNQLVIDAGRPTQPVPSTTAAISIGEE